MRLVRHRYCSHRPGLRGGLAARYMPPEAVQDGNVPQLAMLVRGKDDYGHVDLFEPPKAEDPSANQLRVKSLDRLFRNARSLEVSG